MTQEEKLEALAEVFDTDAGSLTSETWLDEIGWDSMAMLSVIALVKAKLDKRIPGAEIRAFQTVGDILAVMEK